LAVSGGEFLRGGVVVGHDDVRGHADVGFRELVGGLERGAVAFDRVQDGARTHVVVRRESQTSGAGDLGAFAAAAAQDPDLDVGVFAGDDVCFDAVLGPVGTT